MTARGFYTLLFSALMLFTALSVGSAGAFLLGIAALISWLLALVSVLLTVLTCRITQQLASTEVQRGSLCRYHVGVRLLLPMPIAPLALRLSMPNGKQSEFLLRARLIGQTQSENNFSCPHVGVFSVGITHIGFVDCFGMFCVRLHTHAALPKLTVLPRPAESMPVSFSPGEGESSMALRAQADRSTPSDVRTWQDGDELKRVHWKLSMRRQELMVHTYETPQRPDALVLLNCALGDMTGPQRLTMVDVLTESCAGILKRLLEDGHTTRLPLSGRTLREYSGQNSEALPDMLRALAQEPFDGAPEFARVIWDSARRMQRTGSTVLLSCDLTPAIADAAIAISRMGPHTRFTLVTAGDATPDQRKLLDLLLASGLEATHISAA